MVVNAVHASNAYLPIMAILDIPVKEDNETQFPNALSFISVTPVKSIVYNALQLKNA